MGGDRGEGGRGPDLPWKITSCHLFWCEPPSRSNLTPPPPPPPPSLPVGIVWIRACMSDGGIIFLYVAGLAIMLSRAN